MIINVIQEKPIRSRAFKTVHKNHGEVTSYLAIQAITSNASPETTTIFFSYSHISAHACLCLRLVGWNLNPGQMEIFPIF